MGGDRDQLPAAAGRPRPPPGQGHALASRRCSPTSSRRRARSSAAWRSCARSGPPRTRSTPTTASAASPTRRRGTRQAADALERRGDLIAAFAPARRLDLGGHPRRPAAAGHRRRRAAAAGDRDRVAPRAASAPGTAASGCPSARTRRGSTSCSRRRACTSRASTGPTLGDHRAAARSEAGIVLVPLDRPAIDLVWHASGYPSHGDYRDTHRLTPRAHQAWANDGEPYDPERGHARARAHARDVRGASQTAPSSPSTPSCSATTGTRASRSSSACSSWRTSSPFERRRPPPAPVDVPPTSWGAGRDLRTWSAPAAEARVGASAAPS